MRSLVATIHRIFWTRKAAAILRKHPFAWTPRVAASYAQSIYHLYTEEGFSPAEAIECDQQYWED